MEETNSKLEILYDILVDNTEFFEAEMKSLIMHPTRIEDTNKFASLISVLKNLNFVEPLLLQISLSEKGDLWLTDFLYSVINLLDEASVNDEFEVPEKLVAKLEDWILNNIGELSWKAANLLKFLGSESAEKIQLKKLTETGDFFLTYVECLLGLLRYNQQKYLALVKEISMDDSRDKRLRDACDEIISNEYF